MRFKDHITEGPITKYREKRTRDIDNKIMDRFVNEYAPILEKNCKEVVKLYSLHSKLLYRGVKAQKEFIEIKQARKVREPKNMPDEIHRKLNKLFKEKFGWNVRDGISVATEKTQARNYGNVYIFFPTGKWEFAYNIDISDLFSHLFSWDGTGAVTVHDTDDDLNRMVSGYSDKNILNAMNRYGEIMFKTSKYYLLNSMFEDAARKHWGMRD